MTVPAPEVQLRFLRDLQRILGEGSFVATYKFALLMALADLAVERGEDSGDALVLPTSAIAEKFIRYYWPQTAPYGRAQEMLRQNTGKSAAVLVAVEEYRSRHRESLAEGLRDEAGWKRLVRFVDQTVREMPLWKLQTVENGTLECLYVNRPDARAVELLPGVAACFRQLYEIVADLVRGAWIRYVRRHNTDVLGGVSDLEEFLFGSERQPLPALAPVLQDLQAGRCFYCERDLDRGAAHVDHFVPRSRYPADLGHNLVLAHGACNLKKRDHLAAAGHLDRWVERNAAHDADIRAASARSGLIADLPTTLQVARWAYLRTQSTDAPTWLRAATFEPLRPGWEGTLAGLIRRLQLSRG